MVGTTFLRDIVSTHGYIKPCNVSLHRDAYKKIYEQLMPQLDPHPKLYVMESNLRTQDYNGEFTRLVGMGLFTAEVLPKGSFVTSFSGQLINDVQRNQIVKAGKGGYIVSLKGEDFLDCYPQNNLCFASKANDPYKAIDSITKKKAVSNCELVTTKTTAALRVKNDADVMPGSELLCCYGNSMIMGTLVNDIIYMTNYLRYRFHFEFFTNKHLSLQGYYFVINELVPITEDEVIDLKVNLRQVTFDQLKSSFPGNNKGRRYSKNIGNRKYQILPRSVLNFIQALENSLSVLDAQYSPERNRHVHGPSFLKLLPSVTGGQGWHIDQYKRFGNIHCVEAQREDEPMTQVISDDIKSYHDMGYSIFLGLDKVNSLLIGEFVDGDVGIIRDSHRVEFSLGSVLVITDNLVHQGDCYLGVETNFHNETVDDYQLKMFMAVNEHGQIEDGAVNQRWFRPDPHDSYCFRRTPGDFV